MDKLVNTCLNYVSSLNNVSIFPFRVFLWKTNSQHSQLWINFEITYKNSKGFLHIILQWFFTAIYGSTHVSRECLGNVRKFLVLSLKKRLYKLFWSSISLHGVSNKTHVNIFYSRLQTCNGAWILSTCFKPHNSFSPTISKVLFKLPAFICRHVCLVVYAALMIFLTVDICAVFSVLYIRILSFIQVISVF